VRTRGAREWALPALTIAAAGLLAYLPALGAGFVFDDHDFVEQSRVLRDPLWRIWAGTATTDYWPLTWTSLWVEWRLWGPSPAGYHATNVALHLAAALLLWRALAALKLPGAWLAGLLFAVHPVGVESVAWISERKNVLSALPFLGAVLAWVSFEEGGRRRDYAAALLLFLVALLAKTSVVMLPPVLLLLAWYRRGRLERRDWVRTAPFFALALLFGLVTMWFQWSRALPAQALAARGPGERLAGAAWALLFYLRTAFLPFDLAFVYPDWPVAPGSPLFYLPLALLLGALAAAWLLRRSRLRPVLLALGYHALLVLPVLGLVEIAYFHVGPVSNHLQYLALIGPVALLAAGLARLSDGRWRVPALLACAAATLVLLVATNIRARTFRDDATLWQAATRDSPQSLYAAWMYGNALIESGRHAEARAELAAMALRARDEATRLRARSLWSFYSGLPAQAVAEAEAAERLRSSPSFQAHLGQLLARAGQPAEAIAVLGPLVQRAPRYADARYWLAAALSRAGRLEEAAAVLREGCRLLPNDTRLREALASVQARLEGRPQPRP